jgi:hypothetical protein
MFKPLQFLGSEKEISKIVEATIHTLEREYGLRVQNEVIIPVIVDCFIDAAISKSINMLGTQNVNCELNLFEMIRIIHEVHEKEEEKVLCTSMDLGRMAIRKLELEFSEDEVEEALSKIEDVDIKLLEEISIKATQLMKERHELCLRDYQIVFKIAEVFFNELISFIRVNVVTDDTLVVFDQFSILLDDTGRFESITISDYMQSLIDSLYEKELEEFIRLQKEDDEFATNSKSK